ncbi:hypothetical protein GYA28_02885 [Candidatus Roizmanbacteria bacterium]|nr:hypothetical protein [Candidatus Roizmanbacteria bacterium]
MDNLIHNLDEKKPADGLPVTKFLIILALFVAVGIGIGFGISKLGKSSTGGILKTSSGEKKTAGVTDKKTFKDQAEGILREGGIDGEGNFHLERPGGTSQNVYLTSTTVDLSEFVGRKVRVWGQTFSGEKAGWLMDVGLVESL